jgi:hypothetical protein
MLDHPELTHGSSGFVVPLAENPWWLWGLPDEPPPASVPSSEDDDA